MSWDRGPTSPQTYRVFVKIDVLMGDICHALRRLTRPPVVNEQTTNTAWSRVEILVGAPYSEVDVPVV